MASKSQTQGHDFLQGLSALNPEAAAQSMNMLTNGMQFLTMRIEHTFAAQHALLSCKNPTEAYEVQSEFLKTAYEHYNSAAQGMLEALGAQAPSGIQGTKRSYDDVPL